MSWAGVQLRPNLALRLHYFVKNCLGYSQRVYVDFYNRKNTGSAVEIRFEGPHAGDYTLDTTM